MPIDPTDLSRIRTAIENVEHVRGVSDLQSLANAEGGIVVVARVGLSPVLRLADIVFIISEVDAAVREAHPAAARVFVEPDIATDSSTPTEAIVIRALD